MTTIVTIEPLYLDRDESARYLAISTSTFEGLVASGAIAKPRKVSPRRSAWLVDDLNAYGRSRPESDLLPPPDSGYGRAGKAAPGAASPSR